MRAGPVPVPVAGRCQVPDAIAGAFADAIAGFVGVLAAKFSKL